MKKCAILLTSLLLLTTFFSVSTKQYHSYAVDAYTHQTNYDSYSYSGSYYNNISSSLSGGLNGSLRSSLTSLIKPKDWYTYSAGLKVELQQADEDPTNSNNMVYFYTRDSKTKNPANDWNREHVWPQSLSNHNWGTGDGAGSDLLHIRPTYDDTNSKRSSLLYGNVSSSSWLTYENIKYGKRDSTYFEPLDCVKGDCARIAMYIWTAYNSYYTNLPSINNLFESFDVLMQWHILDKPDKLEGNRNDYAQKSVQKNRNPFVDHPEYAWKIFGNNCSPSVLASAKETYPDSVVAPTSLTLSETQKEVYVGDSFSLSVTANPGASNSVVWSSSNSSIASVENGIVIAKAEGTVSITATSTISSNVYASCQVKVKKIPSITSLSISGSPNKTEYNSGDHFDPTGLTITAEFEDGSTKDVTSSVVWSPNVLTPSTTSVTGTFNGKTVTYSPIKVSENQEGVYKLVESNESDLSGTYLIASQSKNKILNGCDPLSSNNSNNQTLITVENKTVSGNYDDKSFTISKTSLGKYKIVSSIDEVMGASSNKDLSSDENYENTISISNGVATITCNNLQLVYNTDGNCFRYYKTYRSDAGKICLYRKESKQPIIDDDVHVTGITLNNENLTLKVGEQHQLLATITPANATNKNVIWSSSDNEAISVNNGLVQVNKYSDQIINVSATTVDGNFIAKCRITIIKEDEPSPTPPKKGCGGSIIIPSVITFGLTVCVLVALILKKGIQNEKED